MASSRRGKGLDLGRLEAISLKRYALKYKLPQGHTRADLELQVSKHFNSQQFMLDDEEVLVNFIRALKANPATPPANQRQTNAPNHNHTATTTTAAAAAGSRTPQSSRQPPQPHVPTHHHLHHQPKPYRPLVAPLVGGGGTHPAMAAVALR